MARGRGGKTGGGGKSSGGSSGGGSSGGGSSGGGSSGGGSSGGGSSGGGSSGGRGRSGKVGGGGKPTSKPTSKPRPTPNRVTTVNTSVSTQNTGRVNPRSPTTNNPQVKTQNEIVRRPIIVSTNPPKIMTRPITLPSGKIWTDRPPVLPNADQNNSDTTNTPTYDGFTMNVGILPSIKKEFALHESGEKLIDPQRLQAIQEGRIIITEGIKTTFTPSEQQLRVLTAMEAQKKAEKDQSRANSEWQKNQDRLQAKIQQMEAQKQQTEDFRNRTDEEILQNFIKVQTQKELAGQFDNPEVPTNLNQYLAERGFDVTRPDTIPTSVFKPTTLDTREKMESAGLASRIINMRLSIDNPNDTVTNVMTNTLIEPSQSVNWNGITETPSLQVQIAERQTASTILYTPPHATNINKPVGRSTPLPPSVTTTGLSPPRTTLVEETVDATASAILPDFKSLALLAGALIIS